jgi:serine/threonine-protein kinase
VRLLDDRAVEGLRALASEPGPGDVLGDRFELGELIGGGGMGLVYKARDLQGGGVVAVKIAQLDGPDDVVRFEREAQALARIDHPSVVRYVAHGSDGATRYLAMELLSGEALADRLARGSLPVADAVELGRRIAEGLAAIHAVGLSHRDVKPSNVFLVDGSPARARLVDFGLARRADTVKLTQTGALVGTPGYMAPEQVRADPNAGAPADVFALGCVLFECLAGRAAFRAETTEALFAQILLETPPLVRALRAEVPIPLEALVEQMLAKAASARPVAEEVARELASFQAGLPTEISGDEAKDAAPRAPFAPGAIVGGKYRVEGTLGQGGMGIVFAAEHVELGTKVALKVLRARKKGTEEARFLREAKATALLEGEHVARVLDVDRLDDGSPFIVMERLTGADLARHLRERGKLSIEDAVSCVLDACDAVGEAHARGIVHRDLKPSNLFLTTRRDGSSLVKVLDFGISKMKCEDAPGAESLTGASSVIGSVAYMSPEQLQDAKSVDARTDVWALGVVLHELLTGAPPFEGEGAAAVGARIAAGRPKRLREAIPDAPAGLEEIILRCLEKDRTKRFPDVRALAAALEPYRRASAVAASAPKKSRTLVITAAAIAMSLGVYALWPTSAPPPPPPPPATSTPTPTPTTTPPATPTPTPTATPTATATATPTATATAKPIASARAPKPTASAAPPLSPPPKPSSREVDLRDPLLEKK